MLRDLQKQLGPVRSRLNLRRASAALATGLVLGGWLAVVAGLMALLGRSYWAGVAGVVALVTVPLAMVLRALVQQASWNEAARAVDRHFQLQDRTATAIHLAAHRGGDAFELLQIDDARETLAPLPLREAVPLNLPWQRLAGGLLLCGFALALLAGSQFVRNLRSLRGSAPLVVNHGAENFARKRLQPDVVDEQAARRGAAMTPAPDADRQPPSAEDLAGRYFDRLQAPSP